MSDDRLPRYTIRFTDGITISVGGRLRTLKLDDGWYAVGLGMCVPCENELEAEEFISQWHEAYGPQRHEYEPHPTYKPVCKCGKPMDHKDHT